MTLFSSSLVPASRQWCLAHPNSWQAIRAQRNNAKYSTLRISYLNNRLLASSNSNRCLSVIEKRAPVSQASSVRIRSRRIRGLCFTIRFSRPGPRGFQRLHQSGGTAPLWVDELRIGKPASVNTAKAS
ncbi:hypothetical protein RRG08_027901 [Elysia crispata]|uniref:Uncharacterized protein n=1 Tax=Elysia crispata TaxID=231223 RepID=A0AAE1DUT4_9GAST|nr:hypothetical protein RRG08_027901 [Elysia crispata]